MNPLQYTSNEMVSSTELIRKSKKLFDKLNKNEIEKAIILRDGKPSFILMDFEKYERIMSEYMELKSTGVNLNKEEPKVTPSQKIQPQIEDKKITASKEIKDEDVEEALAKIEAMSLEDQTEKQKLKEFWD